MTLPDQYWCGCGNRIVTDCPCMRGYTLPRRLRDYLARDALFFVLGMICGAAVMVPVLM